MRGIPAVLRACLRSAENLKHLGVVSLPITCLYLTCSPNDGESVCKTLKRVASHQNVLALDVAFHKLQIIHDCLDELGLRKVILIRSLLDVGFQYVEERCPDVWFEISNVGLDRPKCQGT